MATPEPADGCGLRDKLAAVLPQGFQFGIHHISTPPTKTDALCSAPPGERPDKTYCEKHFLAVSIDVAAEASSDLSKLPRDHATTGGEEEKEGDHTPVVPLGKPVLVLGVEIFIFTTAHLSTLFVSKADSTGFLHMLGLPKGTPSPIRETCATFMRFLVEQRQRKGIQFVVSLFARAQDQYLFPGSIKYSGKHVLDDRGLVRWWCRVLDPLVETPPEASTANAYLVVPGLDTYETRAFVPRRAGAASSWSLQHPLEQISHYAREFDWVPPRCLIPRFPDDPMSRFRDELDEEIVSTKAMKTTGSWKTVKTLDMFWEMMAYRQECSSGRMTGFIWAVFDDKVAQDGVDGALPEPPKSPKQNLPAVAPETPKKQRTISNITPSTTPRRLFKSKKDLVEDTGQTPKSNKDDNNNKSSKKQVSKLKGIIKARQPRIKTKQRNYLLDRPSTTAYYYWPAQGRGQKIADEPDYKRILELLLHLDFATLEKAAGSTRRWLSEAGQGSRWGYDVMGTREISAASSSVEGGEAKPTPVLIHNLSGLVKRKRTDTVTEIQTQENGESKVNVLGGGLIRKKPKEQHGEASLAGEQAKMEADVPEASLSGAAGVEK